MAIEGKRITPKHQKTVYIIDDPDKIVLLADFTQAEILRLLSGRSMMEAQLSEQLG